MLFQIETEAVINSERDQYKVLDISLDGMRRVHGSVVHIDIINDKVWIQYDSTSQLVAEALFRSGNFARRYCLGFPSLWITAIPGFAAS